MSERLTAEREAEVRALVVREWCVPCGAEDTVVAYAGAAIDLLAELGEAADRARAAEIRGGR